MWSVFQRVSYVSALALLLGLPGLSAAAEGVGGVEAGPVSIGGRGMYFDPKDADEGSWQGGAQLRFHLNPVWAIEGSVDYRRDDYNSTRVDIFPVQASLLAHLIPNARLSPFILGGAGWYFTRVKNDTFNVDETDNRFGLHAGGGVQYFLNKYWSLDGTYRYVWLEKFDSKDSALEDKEYSDSGHMITAALNYHF